MTYSPELISYVEVKVSLSAVGALAGGVIARTVTLPDTADCIRADLQPLT